MNKALQELLGAKAAKRPGGEIIYEGTIDEVPVKVSIIFSNLYAQMVYGVTMKIPERNVFTFRLTYETFWAAPMGWDYLTEENAPRSIDLLCELLKTLAALTHG